VKDYNDYKNKFIAALDSIEENHLNSLIKVLSDARERGNKIFIMGNGGSASTASHFVCDLSKNTKKQGIPNFKVIGLADNMASFSAYANDDGYHKVFVHQLESLMDKGDIVIGISTSGNSRNVLEAMEYANKNGGDSVGFTGFDGGKLKEICKLNLHIDSKIIEHVEDLHLFLEHYIAFFFKN